jgi:hypothetical protein
VLGQGQLTHGCQLHELRYGPLAACQLEHDRQPRRRCMARSSSPPAPAHARAAEAVLGGRRHRLRVTGTFPGLGVDAVAMIGTSCADVVPEPDDLCEPAPREQDLTTLLDIGSH